MLCGNYRFGVYTTTLRSDAVGQAKNEQRPKGTHSWSRTGAADLCAGVWVTRWQIAILIYNSDPCTAKSADCTCNPVIIPGHTRIARVEEIQAIQHIGSRETERGAGECALPPHLTDVLDAATDERSTCARS